MHHKRTELQKLLESKLGSKNVYFQPPESVKLKYPCIIYSLNRLYNNFADDGVYLQSRGYMVTVLDKNPDSPIMDAVSQIPQCTFDRFYTVDNINHWAFTIYY